MHKAGLFTAIEYNILTDTLTLTRNLTQQTSTHLLIKTKIVHTYIKPNPCT